MIKMFVIGMLLGAVVGAVLIMAISCMVVSGNISEKEREQEIKQLTELNN